MLAPANCFGNWVTIAWADSRSEASEKAQGPSCTLFLNPSFKSQNRNVHGKTQTNLTQSERYNFPNPVSETDELF